MDHLARKQETRRGAQCEAEAPSEAWRVLLVTDMDEGDVISKIFFMKKS